MIKHLLCLVVFTILSLHVFADFRHLSTKNGLSQNDINCVFQDSKGFVWVGTHDGLNRFDGLSIEVFHPTDKPYSIKSNLPYTIIEDKRGYLWIGSSDLGISRYDPRSQQFVNFYNDKPRHLLTSNRVTNLTFDKQGNLWVGTVDGLNKIEAESLYGEEKDLKIQQFYYNPHNPTSLHSSNIKSIYCDKYGKIWVGSAAGLQRFIPNEQNGMGAFESFENIPNIEVLGIIEGNNRIIMFNNSGVFWFDPNTDRPYEKISDLTGIRALIFSASKEIWVGTVNGLYQCTMNRQLGKLEVKEHFKHDVFKQNSISTNVIRFLTEDQNGNIWVGTNGGGINFYNPHQKKFHQFTKNTNDKSLNISKVKSLYEDRNGNLWVGLDGMGIDFLERKYFLDNNYDHFIHLVEGEEVASQRVAYDICEWKNKVYIGCGYPKKLMVFEKGIPTQKQLDQQQKRKDITNAIFCLKNDGDSILWMGSYDGGLYRQTMQANGEIKIDNFVNGSKDKHQLASKIVRSIAVDKKGNLLIGTDLGLRILPKSEKLSDQPKFEYVSMLPAKESHYILSTYVDSENNYWIGTLGKGLFKVQLGKGQSRGGKFEVSQIGKNSLSNNVIKAIVEDNYGNIWVSTNKGLNSIDMESFDTRIFSYGEGLQDNEFSENAALKQANGRLMFGGVNGVNYFFPHEIVEDRTTAPIQFTNLYVNNTLIQPQKSYRGGVILQKSITYSREITLNYYQNNFSIDFACLHFGSPENNVYKYFLEGFDDQWSKLQGQNRTIRYTNLPSGEYTLRLKGANYDGIMQDEDRTLKITVLKPWWYSHWAVSVYIILGLIILWFASRFTIISAQKKQQLIMDHFEREKLEELSQLKMMFFTNISHELRTPLTLIHGPLQKMLNMAKGNGQQVDDLQLISKNVNYLMRLINQLMDFRKVENGKMDLKVRVYDWHFVTHQALLSFQELADQKKISISFHSDQKNILGWMDLDKYEKILYNLLSNAFKFTEASGQVKVTVGLKQHENIKGVCVQVTDTGCGIPQDQQPLIFERFYQVNTLGNVKKRGTGIGLSFSKSLVELHHGTIDLESKIGEGSTFVLWFPLEKEAYDEDEIIATLDQDQKDEYYLAEEENEEIGYVETRGRKRKIPKVLIVEDNPDIRKFIVESLKENHYLYEAENGKEALEVIKTSNPDIIISDIMMPEMDGYELVKAVRNDIDYCHLPIILLTAKTEVKDQIHGFENGADAFVSKPFNPEVLIARIHSLVNGRQVMQKKFRKGVDVSPSEVTTTSMDEKFLSRLMSILEEHISNSEFTVEMLAREYGASTISINQKLKALSGQTAKSFIRTVRLKRAAQLLELDRFSVSEVTYEVGFNDLKYFRNCFKKEFGICPSQYGKKEDIPQHEEIDS
ncbi:hybrid sensor histidine kinase/response regulator transcription factor [Persicobacter psychrovividus]|uniref:histidine kinase n=1 Tax=Persicobacter psychrovividus TaxID=387638 RepID=A0ABN6LGQ6_9BACT|nr:hybrid sensor histidine kinase/response regulator [Persicobacter psychrovividus]